MDDFQKQELNMADKMYEEYPEDSFRIAMGEATLGLSLSSAIYAKVCNEVEKKEDLTRIRALMNSLNNFDLSKEAQRKGYRNKDMAIEIGKDIVASRLEKLERKNSKNIFKRIF